MTEADREWEKIIESEICKHCMFYKARVWNKASRCKLKRKRVNAKQNACNDYDELTNNYVVYLGDL
jgi:hypothetical protein